MGGTWSREIIGWWNIFNLSFFLLGLALWLQVYSELKVCFQSFKRSRMNFELQHLDHHRSLGQEKCIYLRSNLRFPDKLASSIWQRSHDVVASFKRDLRVRLYIIFRYIWTTKGTSPVWSDLSEFIPALRCLTQLAINVDQLNSSSKLMDFLLYQTRSAVWWNMKTQLTPLSV